MLDHKFELQPDIALFVSGLSKLMTEDATGWDTLTIGLAEVIGTAMFVFIGCTGCIGTLTTIPSVLQIALTFGLAVMIAIQVNSHTSLFLQNLR